MDKYETNLDNETVEVTEARVDYAVLMRETLIRLQDEVANTDNPNLKNLVTTALDYLFYLEDNRRVIL